MSLEQTARNLGVDLISIQLEMGQSKKEWKSVISGEWKLVEDAVLDYFVKDGWRGYSKEGGLVLNLIKAMSFPAVELRNRATYIEALYAQNVAFDEDRYEVTWLLNNVESAKRKQIEKNYQIMAAPEKHTSFGGGFSQTSSTSMLDFFPGLEEWMFTELFEALGNQKLLEIARKFSENPYEYRKGWPDITMWKNEQVQLLEVKSPGDRVRKSQRIIVNEFIKPLRLDFVLVDVQPETKPYNPPR